MRLLKRFYIVVFCICLGSALCAQGVDFDTAKQRLETDGETLLKAAAAATGTAAVLTGAFVLRQYLHGMKSVGMKYVGKLAWKVGLGISTMSSGAY